MLFSLFLVTLPNKLLYFVCIRYLVVLQWLRPWVALLLNLIVLNLIVLVYCYKSNWFLLLLCIYTSLVKLSDGANFLGLHNQIALHQQIRFFRSHMAGRDGSVTSNHLFCNISENNGTATLIL